MFSQIARVFKTNIKISLIMIILIQGRIEKKLKKKTYSSHFFIFVLMRIN